MASRSQDQELTAAQRWVEAREAWKAPAEIRAGAPGPRAGFDVARFVRFTEQAMSEETPSRRIAREAVPVGGSVLDVGCGAGAAGLPLVPPAVRVIGVDPDPAMLAAFAERADALGVAHQEIEGSWPAVADRTPPADVVVCRSVFFGIADLVPFTRELTAHARRRVVVQLPEQPPQSWLRPYWKAVHGRDLPHTPTADDAAAVVREAGFDPRVERWERPARDHDDGEERVARLRRSLYLGPERDPQLRALLERHPPPAARRVVTLWWNA